MKKFESLKIVLEIKDFVTAVLVRSVKAYGGE